MSNFVLFIFFAFLGRHFPSIILLILKFYHYSGDLVIIDHDLSLALLILISFIR